MYIGKNMGIIRRIDFEVEKHDLLKVIQQSFLTVADEFNITIQNAPTNPAFLAINKLEESVNQNVNYFIYIEEDKIVGCVGIQPGKNDDEYYIERLGVLPDYRHRGIGRKLLEYSIQEIKKRNCGKISIGIINENKELKEWYQTHGFQELGIKRFDHLPFTVCFMGMQFMQ